MSVCNDLSGLIGNGVDYEWSHARNTVQKSLELLQAVVCVDNTALVDSGTDPEDFIELGWPDGLPDKEDSPVLYVIEGLEVWVCPNLPAADVGTNPATPGTGTSWIKMTARFSRETGEIIAYSGSSEPQGWLFCDGRAVSRATYATLFAVIGETYGVGDGGTTFNLPDLRGRIPMGLDNLGGTSANRVTASEADTLGGASGFEEHTLLVEEMPSHQHSYSRLASGLGDRTQPAGGTIGSSTANTGSAGGGLPHNNMQPYLAVNYLVKT